MSQLPSGRFLSLIPELHKVAVIIDEPVISTAVDSPPQSPEAKPIDKTRRSSSSASAMSLPGDQVSEIQGKQFLKLGP
ncbi:hypothetical protein H2198_001674 [Neophaeococcomyces mojaviensis]|uniref:Uncharacterized protein n=1 Tax=Neophaeococcomyces mojaviensis TaxID=3383035 RepID=A0ACC3AGV8_9EURO|nr:hypothetical protein H2198_001674 [Knufia sp. JES_112]